MRSLSSGRLAALVCGLLLAAATPSAQANMRGPAIVWASPSGGLAPGEGLVLIGETLTLRCVPNRCAVEAVYTLRAPGEARLSTHFILPAGGAPEILVGAGQGSATLTFEPVTVEAFPEEHRYDLQEWVSESAAVAQARVEAILQPGVNTLTVRYTQPLLQLERGYGYFSDGVFVDVFEYHLWPILEWARDPGFRLALDISIERAPPSLWARLFGDPISIACPLWDDEGIPLMRAEQREDRLVYGISLGAEALPPVLRCEIGALDQIVGG